MKQLNLVLLLLLMVSTLPLANPQSQSDLNEKSGALAETAPNRTWGRGEFRTLVVGRSTGVDMRRVLGPPDTSAYPDGQSDDDPNGELLNYYRGVGDVLGQLTVAVAKKTDLITSMDFVPDEMTLKDVTARFGKDYIVVHYEFDECLGDEESAPIYESPSGSLTSIEYRSRGIAVAIDTKDKVIDIRYVEGPIGSEHSQCKNIKTQHK